MVELNTNYCNVWHVVISKFDTFVKDVSFLYLTTRNGTRLKAIVKQFCTKRFFTIPKKIALTVIQCKTTLTILVKMMQAFET